MPYLSSKIATLRIALKAAAGFTPLVALTLHTQPVYAQLSSNNVISACSGVSLPASVVTDIMKPVITGIAGPLETRVNSVTGLLGALVGSPTPLTLGTTNLLNTAASGAPITLQVLNTNGQVVNNSDPCYSQAAGFTLKNAAGISIGGNQLTGLGSGVIATAGEVNSIAFGNNAQTAATALGSIALGTNASVGTGAIGSIAFGNGAQATAANSIALGAGSTASRGGQTYTGFALSAPTTSVGEFSVGTTGSLRQITNVAPGSSANDAVNVAQLQSVSNAVTTTSNTLTTVGNTVTALDGVAIKYDGVNRLTATLGGVGGTTLTNVKAGDVTGASTDAVNGAQLFATNTNVTNAGNAITTLTNQVINAAVGAVRYSNAGTPTVPNAGTITQDVTLAGATAGAAVKLHNVADGVIVAGSTDAVNGGQLASTNAAVALNTGSIGTLNTTVGGHTTQITANMNAIALNTANIGTNTTDIANLRTDTQNGAIGTVQFSSTLTPTIPNGGIPSQDMALIGGAAGAVRLHNVANGTIAPGSTDAVNGGQLASTNADVTALGSTVSAQGSLITANTSAITANAGAITLLRDDANNGALGPLRYSASGLPLTPSGTPSQDLVLVGGAAGAVKIHNLADGSITAGSNDAVNGGQIFDLTASLGSLSGLAVQYDDGTQTGMTFGAPGGAAVALKNVANGTIGAGSTDAVNGEQLFATNAAVSVAQTDVNTLNLDLINVGNQVLANSSSIQLVGGNLAQLELNIGNGSVGPLQYSSPQSPTTPLGSPSQDVMLVGATFNPVTLHNVANGLIGGGSKDAVNGGQLFGVGAGVAALLGYTYDPLTNSFAGSFRFGPTQHTSVQNVFDDIYTQMAGSSGQTSNTASKYFHTTSLLADSSATGADATAIGPNAVASGEAAIAAGRDAVASGGGSVAIGDGATAQNSKAVSIGFASIASGYGATSIGSASVASHDNSVALGTATGTTRGGQSGYAAFGLDTAQSSIGELAVARNLVYADPVTGLPLATGARQITGVAAGSLGTDAVNVSQLSGAAANLGNAFASSIGGGAAYEATTGTLSIPGFTYNGVSYASINDTLAAVATQTSAGWGSGSGSGHSPVYDDASQTSVTLGGAGGTTVQNVAPGAVSSDSTEAVNGAQLAATNDRVAAVENGAAGAVQYSHASTPTTPNGGTKTNDVTLVGAQAAAPVGVHNVAAGQVATGSTDAVNGGQLAATNAAVQGAQDTATQALTIQSRSVRYDSDGQDALTLGATGGAPVALRNVAEGVSGTDAVNVSQMNAGIESAVAQSNAYTDSRLAALTFDLKKVSRNADAGSAAALAAAGMPQAYEAGKGMLAMGAGTYGGQSAIAMGFSKASDDGRFVLKAGATYNSRGKIGANAGIGWQI